MEEDYSEGHWWPKKQPVNEFFLISHILYP